MPCHIHLQHKVDTSPQVEAQIHGQRTNMTHPLRGIRQQVQGNDVITTHFSIQNIPRFDLGIGIGKPDLDSGGFEYRSVVGETMLFEYLFSTLQKGHIGLNAGPQG